MRDSIRRRLTVAFVISAIAPLVLIGIIQGWRGYLVQQEYAIAFQRQLVESVSTASSTFIQSLEQELRLVLEVRGMQGLPRAQQESILSELLAHEGQFNELVLLDSQGREQIRLSRVTIYTPDDLGDRSQADEFVIASAGKQSYYSPVKFDDTTSEPLMTIAVPFFDLRSGELQGVLIAEARIKKVWDVIAGIERGNRHIYIVDAQNRVVAHDNPSVVLLRTVFSPPRQEGLNAGIDGTNVILVSREMQIGQQAFTVVAEEPLSETLVLVFNTWRFIAVLIVIALLVVWWGFMTIRQIFKPIETLATAARAVSTGDLNQYVEVIRNDEIGTLAEAFNNMTSTLRRTLSGLEQQVQDRTKEVERRAVQITAGGEIARFATTILDPDQLIKQVVDLIRERFDFYYVGLFLTDVENRYAVLQYGMGTGTAQEAGQLMKDQGHKLEIGGGSMIGWACANKQARIALDVGKDAVRFANPRTPDTRSEMALPLRVAERVTGALTIQSTLAAAFDEGDIAALQGMADQIAVALENARLFQQTQQTLRELDEANRLLAREGWQQYLVGTKTHEAEYRPPGIRITSGPLPHLLQVPLQLGEQTLGALTIERGESNRPWTAEETETIQAIVQQAMLSLDNARLFEESQKLAARERLINEITARIRSSTTLEGVLNTAVHEISLVTGAKYAGIELDVGQMD